MRTEFFFFYFPISTFTTRLHFVSKAIDEVPNLAALATDASQLLC